MQANTNDQVYAGFFVRLAAFLVDLFIVNVGLLTVRFPIWKINMMSPDNFMERDLIFQYSLWDILIYLLTVVYFVLMTYYTGSTLGKKLFHLRVVSTEGRELSFYEVVYRETIGRFLAKVICFLGYFLILLEKEKRGIHDLLADTCVIYYHEKKIYTHSPVVYRDMTGAGNYAPSAMQQRNEPESGQPAADPAGEKSSLEKAFPGQQQVAWERQQSFDRNYFQQEEAGAEQSNGEDQVQGSPDPSLQQEDQSSPEE